MLVLDYLYALREGEDREKVEQLRQLLATDPTRRHFLGRFGARGLLHMMQKVGLALPPLQERIQTWCEQDLQRHVERATSAQLQQTAGLKDSVIGG
ncbi:MAG: hypothetical protein HYZ50_08520 [Deltaproteobacteria bacterium]|nr:hypothetical protein [Deltaproteobacteria bacterium]